jgi:hypothetical protein
MARTRKVGTEHDRDSKRIHVAFTAEEFAAIAKLADSEFASLADTAHDLAMAALAGRDGKAPKVSGLAAAKEDERTLRNRLLEIEVAKRERQIISIDKVMEVISADYANIRSRLLNVPQAIAGLGLEQVFDANKAIQDVMTDLSGESQGTWDDITAEAANAA